MATIPCSAGSPPPSLGAVATTAVAVAPPSVCLLPQSAVARDLLLRSAVAGDFDRDGNLDLAVADDAAGIVRVLFGDGRGGFPRQQDFALSRSADLAAGDFDNDGLADLAVVESSGLTFLRGSAGGVLAVGAPAGFGGGATAIAAGDLNGDGHADLVTCDRAESRLAVFLGNGDMTFRPSASYATGVQPVDLGLADFDGDGRLDLAIAESGSQVSGSGTLSIRFGNGQGGFGAAQTRATGGSPVAVAAVDVDGDGFSDVALANRGSDSITLLYGGGAGGLNGTAAVRSGFASDLGALAAGDFNRDGRPDLVVASADGAGVAVLLNAPAAVALAAAAPKSAALGVPFRFAVTARDACGNVAPGYRGTVSFSSDDVRAALPEETSFTAEDGGTKTFTVALAALGKWTLEATDVNYGLAATAEVMVREFAGLQVLLPGEIAAPGTPSGKSGETLTQTAGRAFTLTVRAVDPAGETIAGIDHLVGIGSSDSNAILPPDAVLEGGMLAATVVLKTAGSWTFSATDRSDAAQAIAVSSAVTNQPNVFTKLQLLVPGEVAAPGTGSGKTGTPTSQVADIAFNVTVNAVDDDWNVEPGVTDVVGITSSDVNAVLPSNAALVSGTQTFSVALRTPGSRTLTATDITDGSKTANTSPGITVVVGAFAKLQILVPGETAAPSTPTGKTGTPNAQRAGTAFNVIVRSVDSAWNLVSSTNLVGLTSSDTAAFLPTNSALVAGTRTFTTFEFRTEGNWTVTATNITDGSKTPDTSPLIASTLGPFARMQILAPGETADPGGAATGKTGTPTARVAGVAFDVTVNAVDSNFYLINTVTDTVGITSSDANAILPPNNALVAGTQVFSVTLKTAGAGRTVTATNITDGTKTAQSSTITVTANTFVKLQILVPGETAAPGAAPGKTGTPNSQRAGTAFNVIVRAVDDYWNLVSSTNMVGLTSSDAAAFLPVNRLLVAGTTTFTTFEFRTEGNWTVTATNITDGSKTPDTSPLIASTLGPFARMQILAPGETADPGGAATGKTGTPTPQVAGVAFDVTVNAVDSNFYLIVTAPANTVGITSNDANAILPPNNALVAGTQVFSVTLKTGGSRTVTATNLTDGTKTAQSSTITVNANAFVKLQILVPGETAAPGTATGKTGSPTAQRAGTGFNITVRAVDDYWNLVSSTNMVGLTSSDPAALLPVNRLLVAGTTTFTTFEFRTEGNWTVTATNITDGSKTPDTSPAIASTLGPFFRMQILAPGETADPGGAATGKTGTPTTQVAGAPFNVTVNAVDSNFYLINTVTDTVGITSSDANAILPPNNALVAGTQVFSVTLKSGGSRTVTATDITDGTKTAQSSTIAVGANAFVKMQILVPGESAAPGSALGKTGTPTTQRAGTAFNATVNAVDDYWNRVSTVLDTVQITSSDSLAILPPNNSLASGTQLFSVTLRTVGSSTVTATDLTDETKTADTSTPVSAVLGPFAKMQILVPGETADPGSLTGKTGLPTARTAGTPFDVTVNAVDSNWYLINTVTDVAGVLSSDSNAILPPDAPLVGGTAEFNVTLNTGSPPTRTVTGRDITDTGKAANISGNITVNAGAFVKMQILAPGETAAPGTAGGKTGTPSQRSAGVSFSVTLSAVDAVWNRVTTVNDGIGLTSNDPNATLPASNVLIAGTRTLSLTLNSIGNWTVTVTDLTDGSKPPDTTPLIPVITGPFTKLQILVPGEVAAPGTATGKTGTPASQSVGIPFDVTVNAVDPAWNLVAAITNTVGITSSDGGAILPPNAPLIAGTQTFSVTLTTSGNQTVTATNITDGTKTPDTSPPIAVALGAFTKLQVLVPGETAAPGTGSGKTGTPVTIAAGTPFSVTVNAVDAAWNRISSVTDTVGITSTDGGANLPADTPLVAGTVSLNVTFSQGGSFTLTASDITDGLKLPNTSPSITVIGETAGTPATALKWTGTSDDTLEWGAAVNATSYRVYEGIRADLPNLLTGATDSCLRFDGAGTTTGPVITQVPAPGTFTWYLVTGVNSGVEGGAGNATAGVRILNSTGSCP